MPSWAYNGLGLRVGKADSTGTYSYVCDGTSPGSPVLADGHALYTPGLSETRSGVSSFYSFDKQGNLWTVDGTSKNQLNYEDFSGFGDVAFASGVNMAPFKFSGGNGCQTDVDTGLVLMGHRYYDSRIGRFISQDPAGAGSNWYAYAGNNPTNEVDPTGLTPSVSIEGSSPLGSPGSLDIGGGTLARGDYEQNFSSLLSGALSRQDFAVAPVKVSAEFSPADGAGDLLHLLDPYIPEKYRTQADIASNLAIVNAAYPSAMASYNAYTALAESADAFAVISPGVFGLSTELGAQAIGALACSGLSSAAAVGAAGFAGWETGTWISKQPWGPGGQTVTDFWSGQFQGVGNWMQKNTSFGH